MLRHADRSSRAGSRPRRRSCRWWALGSWITFNVGDDPVARAECVEVMRAFFANGGRLIDSSPMYGSSQSVIGNGVGTLAASRLFSADKVWTGGSDGRAQIGDESYAALDRLLAKLG